MSYASALALQEAVYLALSTDTQVNTLTSGQVFDALPPGPVPPIYVTLGPEKARDSSDVTGDGAVHDFPVTVVSDASGFLQAKQIAVAVSDALSGAELPLTRGALTALNFRRAVAKRVGANREIEVWFRAFIDSSGT